MTREDVIRHIVEREAQRQPLDEEAICSSVRDLHAAAIEHFGLWETALRYAGVRKASSARQYSSIAVIQSIRRICREGYDLSGRRNKARDRRLYDAAIRHFGTWRRALTAAGIDLNGTAGFSKSLRNRKRRIVRAIHARQTQRLSLVWTDVCLENRALAIAAKSVYGNWPRALAAAERSIVEGALTSTQRWTKERVIQEIRRRSDNRHSLKYNAARGENAALVAAARRHFGSWGQALAAAGVGV